MTKLALYPFRFRDPVTGRWVRAHHVEERAVIEACSDGLVQSVATARPAVGCAIR